MPDPLKLDPDIFIVFLDAFKEYVANLKSQKLTERQSYIVSTTSLLISTFESDYKNTLATINRLKSHKEITFDTLYAILVPRTTFVTRCAITGVPRLFELESSSRVSLDGVPCYQLNCESYDLVDRPATQTVGVGRVSTSILLRMFKGTVKIDTLDAFPMKYHPDVEALTRVTLDRAKKWVGLIGVHHRQFSGLAALKVGERLLRHNVKGRIMVDRGQSYQYPPLQIH